MALLGFHGQAFAGELVEGGDEQPAAEEQEENDQPEALAAANPFPRRFKAPDLDGGNGWLNTDGEITMRDLRGKVVLLDFWTFCCINCMHVLPDLKYLEQKYGKQLVVIGVHSAKFENEKETENIRRAIMRYDIEHPVINDSDMTIWRKFGVNSWPTLVLIDPEGEYCGYISGEGHREALEQVLDKLIAFHKRKGTLDESPVKFDLERGKAAPTALRFPGKLLADEAGRRLFISDSNHNRIVIASLDGRLLDAIGSGVIGAENGAYDRASFDHPQGLALVGETLYVADTENHLIRAVDLEKKQVTTLAGTGKQASERRAGGALLRTALNSPWDLVALDGKLYVAMAGPHQIWVADLKKRHIEPYAGSGREDILNGPLAEAALAQPSGMATDGKFLYVVDSEGSALRQVPLDRKGEVTTLIGTSDLPNGRCLFEFGDQDGVGSEARLQHPLGVAFANGALYVADSYNHKIKRVDLSQRSVKTFVGDGQPGDQDDPPRFSEPAGLSVAGGTLYIADTNNHRIRTVDLKSGAVSTLTIEGLSPPLPPKSHVAADDDVKKPSRVKPQRVAAGEALTFEVTLNLPEGYKLNALAPLSYRLKAIGDQSLISPEQLGLRQQVEAPEGGEVVKFSIPLSAKSGKGELHVTLSYGFCREGSGGLCKLGTHAWTVPIEIDGEAEGHVIRLESK
ncbi:MAG: redoxin domain-containing protein [Planctomycetaceae bacterium]|nr:redoxin domain-containing protein [Planctomycetaceae bacterium]